MRLGDRRLQRERGVRMFQRGFVRRAEIGVDVFGSDRMQRAKPGVRPALSLCDPDPTALTSLIALPASL